ncbi:5-hydroxytryptamine receptor 3A-like [Scomber japonicus]|uniref:5-hydroxytryptamine receptor 3A-like n=1 Tax=Scomber japonicus TaxID=13676 RepID=UPI0023060267|nr:5-hydroxytryptamine receptor 3A-like [Scomber japonicus]
MTNIKTAGLMFICFALPRGFEAALNCKSPSPEALSNALNLLPKNLVRPVKRFSDTLNVTIRITLVGILGVDEKAQSLTTFIWQFLEWDIAGLNWDEEECGTKKVSVPREKFWIPDIYISEFMDEDKSPKAPYVYLLNTGHVYDSRPIRVVSSCRLGIYTFPFDVQNCSLTFESYLHYASDITMIQGATAAKILKESRKVIQTNGEWELADIEVVPSTLKLDEGTFSQMAYYIILRRRPILYVVNLLVPSCFLLTLDIFSFLLPLQSVDRCSFKMTLILGYMVFLLMMTDLLPVTGEIILVINVFFSISLALMVASLLETIFISNIQSSSSQYNMAPNWLSIFVLRYLAVLVCIPPKKKSNRVTVSLVSPDKGMIILLFITSVISTKELQGKSDNTSEKPPQEPALDELRKIRNDLAAIRLQMERRLEGTKNSKEWYMIGIVIDRLLFGMYIVFISVSCVIILCIWSMSNSYVR